MNDEVKSQITGQPLTILERQRLAKELLLKKQIVTLSAEVAPVIPKPTAIIANKILTPEEITSNLLQIPDLLTVGDDEFEHVLAYGAPGTGKTLAACALSEFYNLLVFDGDKGMRTALTNLPDELKKRIRIIKIPDNTSNPMFWATMLKVITGRQQTLCTDHGIIECPICKSKQRPLVTVALNQLPKDWIVLMDSQTQFVASAVAAINLKATGKKDVVDEFKFEFDHWGALKSIVDKFGNYVKDLRCNFITVSHEMLLETEDEKAKKLVAIGGSENASRSYAKYFGTAVYCKVINNRHTYITSSTYSGSVTTKSRSNVVLEAEPTPSFLHLFRQDAKEHLKGSWNEWFFLPEKEKKLKPAPKPKEVIKI